MPFQYFIDIHIVISKIHITLAKTNASSNVII